MIKMFDKNNRVFCGITTIVEELINNISNEDAEGLYYFIGLDTATEKELNDLNTLADSYLVGCDDDIYYTYTLEFDSYEDDTLYGFYNGDLLPIERIIKIIDRIKNDLEKTQKNFIENVLWKK